MSVFKPVLGIDLGSARTVIYSAGKGIVLDEPSVVAMDNSGNILAIGKAAREMLGKTPDQVQAVKPIVGGVIAHYKASEVMLKFFIEKVLGKYALFRPEIMVSIPSSVSSTERRAVMEVVLKASAREVFVVRAPVLAAVGSGIPIQEPKGRMVIVLGAGTTDIAVVSLGGVVVSKSIKVGGETLDHSIVSVVKQHHNVVIGDKTAETIKKAIGRATTQHEVDVVIVKGRDYVTGLPKEVKINSDEVTEAIEKDLKTIVRAIKDVFFETPPEISADIFDTGILLSGGGALLGNLAEYMKRELGVEARVGDKPEFAVALGTGVVMGHLDLYKRSVISKKAEK
jgi:rod shape-determining protein MreB